MPEPRDGRSRPVPATRPPEPPGLEPEVGFAPEDDDGRLLRRTLAVAVVFHLLVLAAPLPRVAAVAPPEPERVVLRVSPTPRFKPPEKPPEPELVREREAVRVPVPDPTPDDPEPIRPLEVLQPEIEAPEIAWFDDVPPPPPPADPGPVRIRAGIERPVAVFAPTPVYPEPARRAGVQGYVILRTVIDREGWVTQIEVLKELPFGLTREAIQAVERWRYRPATFTASGEPVAVVMEVTVHFSLR